MPAPILIDTDTASDDAVALIMALRSPHVSVEGITVVAGNVPLEQAVRNALYTVELCGTDVPVHVGAPKPLARELETAEFFHGVDGLGDRGYPAPQIAPADGVATDALIATIEANPGIVLVTLGPLTNVALALQREPAVTERVSRCVIMGGAACTIGNITPAAEFNLWVDPEAARIVFESGLPIEMVGWELCRGEANLTDDEMANVKGFDTPLAHFAIDCNSTAVEANRRQSGDPGLGLPDPVAMAIALDSSICTRRSAHRVQVETESPLTRGMTVVDQLDVADEPHNEPVWGALAARAPNATICWEIDVPAFKEMLYSVLRADTKTGTEAGAYGAEAR
jgi:purine nucleosidase